MRYEIGCSKLHPYWTASSQAPRNDKGGAPRNDNREILGYENTYSTS